MFKHFVRFTIWVAMVFMVSTSGIGNVFAQEKESAPLPLHGIEGYGGIAATYSAYLTNPASSGKVFGKPSFGAGGVAMAGGKFLGFATITETLWDRVELGYGLQTLSLDDLPNDIETATGVKISDDFVTLHNFNARVALVKEGEFDKSWMPAITAGIHYKYNDTVSTM
ncbi:MAG: hypothetical protein L3J69_10825, partial [Desulfobacula sp.]|nr:hypothetical protein [Desulfobacula sp.]